MNPQPEHSTVLLCSFIFVCMVVYFTITSKPRHNIFTNDLVEFIYEIERNPSPIHNKAIATITPSATQRVVKKKINRQQQKPTQQIIANNTKCYVPANILESVTEYQKQITKKDFTDIHNDCVNALMSLGMKKREATNTVIKIFNKHQIESIEDFIKKAFVPDEYYRPSN
jgi:hypothetical protein